MSHLWGTEYNRCPPIKGWCTLLQLFSSSCCHLGPVSAEDFIDQIIRGSINHRQKTRARGRAHIGVISAGTGGPVPHFLEWGLDPTLQVHLELGCPTFQTKVTPLWAHTSATPCRNRHSVVTNRQLVHACQWSGLYILTVVPVQPQRAQWSPLPFYAMSAVTGVAHKYDIQNI